MSTTTDELRALTDRQEIEAVLRRYCRGIDRCDPQVLKSAYHKGAIDDHGVFKGDAEDFATMILPILEANYSATQHHLTNISIDLDGDVAHGETYFVAVHKAVAAPVIEWSGGRYLDRFERRDGRWAIADRLVVMDWIQNAPAGDEHPMAAMFTYGARRANDPSYQRGR